MALPSDVSTFTLTFGHSTNGYTDSTGAIALVGAKVKLWPVDLVTGKRLVVTHVATGQVIVPVDVTVTIDAEGKATVGPLPHTDNPTLSPVGFGYDSEWQVGSGSRRVAPRNKTFAVPASAGSTVDFDLLDVAAAVPGVLVPMGVSAGVADAAVSALLPGPSLTQAAFDGRYATDAELAAGLAGKQDAATLGADVAANTTVRAAFVAQDSPIYARTVAGSPPPPPPQLKVIDTFQAGHAWVFANNDPASSLAVTGDPALGSQYVRMVSQGLGAATPVRLTRSGMSPTLDMTGRKFAILLRINNSQNLDNVFLYAGSAGFAAFNLFQLDRYADDRAKAWFRDGEWVWMVFGHETLNAVTGTPPRGAYVDLRIAIVDKGAGGKVTADVAAIASVPEPAATSLAGNGVISFTCDDNWRSQFTAARPILDKYLYPATAYIIADAVGTTLQGGEGSMSLAELQQLQAANRWEIAAHSSTLAHHNALGGFTLLTAAELDAEHLAMKSWLKVNGFRGYEHMAYPQGAYSPTVLDRTRAWFVSGRTTNGYANENWPPNDPHRIRGLGLDVGITLAAAKARVDKVVAGKGWLPIFFHKIGSVADSLTWTPSDFTALVDYVAASGAAVRTVGDVLNSR